MAVSTFNCSDQTQWSWVQRAEVCLDLVVDVLPKHCSGVLADIGCGDRKLLRALEGRGLQIRYQGYDLNPQSEEVEAFDVRRDLLPSEIDLAVMLGVTEYLEDLPAVLRSLSSQAPRLILSHVIRQSDEYTPERRAKLGWLNHLSRDELREIVQNANFEVLGERMDLENKTLLLACQSTLFHTLGSEGSRATELRHKHP